MARTLPEHSEKPHPEPLDGLKFYILNVDENDSSQSIKLPVRL